MNPVQRGNIPKVRTKPAIAPIHYAVVDGSGRLLVSKDGSGQEMIFGTRREAQALLEPMDPDKASRRVVMVKLEVIA